MLASVIPAENLRRIAPPRARKAGAAAKETPAPEKPAREKKPSGIIVKGSGEPLLSFGPCCQPLPGEEIVAYLMPNSGLIVHRSKCPKIMELDPEKIIPARWAPRTKGIFMATIKVVSSDKKGLLSKMSGAITEAEANITKAMVSTSEDQKAVATFKSKSKTRELSTM